MKLYDIRKRRLLKEGFAPFEARGFAKAKVPLKDFALKELRKQRKAEWRATRKAGLGKSSLNRQIAFMYRIEGLVDRGRLRPLGKIREIRERPAIIKAERLHRAQRETSAGREGRYRLLIKAGFFPWEARLMAAMKDVKPSLRRHTFDSAPWQAMIKNHRTFVDKMLRGAIAKLKRELGKDAFMRLSKSEVRRLAKEKLSKLLRAFYAASKYSPFDWLKAEYRPKRTPKGYFQDKGKKQREDANKRIAQIKKQAVQYFD